MPEKSFELVNIVSASTPSASMLTINRIYPKSAGPNADDQRILQNIMRKKHEWVIGGYAYL